MGMYSISDSTCDTSVHDSFVACALSHSDVLKYASVRHGLSASLYF